MKKEDKRVGILIDDVQRQLEVLRDAESQSQSLLFLNVELSLEILRELRTQRLAK